VFAHVASTPNCTIYPLDEIVVRHLPTRLKIHDAIIIATAIVFRDVLKENTSVITKDAAMAASGLVQVTW
jgi:hypothetical protein